MISNIFSLALLAILGAPRYVVAQTDTTPAGSGRTSVSRTAAEQVVAEAPIWGPNNGSNGFAYLPVTVHGHQGTLVIDLTCTACDLKLGADALQTAGIPVPNATTWDALTIGPVVQHHVPITVFPSLGNVPAPPNVAPIIGSVGVHFLTTHYDILYDFPHRIVRLYAPPEKPVSPKTAWLPPGFTSADCGKMVHIPPGAGTFTGVKMKINGHAVTGALEMGPYYPKMNARALQALGSSTNLPKVHLTDPTPIYGNHMLIANVDSVEMTVGTRMFGAWNTQVLQEIDVQTLLPPNTPIMLMNLTMLRDVAVFNAKSSGQVCFAKP